MALRVDVRSAFDTSVLHVSLQLLPSQYIEDLMVLIEQNIFAPVKYQTLLVEDCVVPLESSKTVAEALGTHRTLLLIQQRPRNADEEWQQAWRKVQDGFPSSALIRYLLPHVTDPNAEVESFAKDDWVCTYFLTGRSALPVLLEQNGPLELCQVLIADERVNLNGAHKLYIGCGCNAPRDLGQHTLVELAAKHGRYEVLGLLLNSGRLDPEIMLDAQAAWEHAVHKSLSGPSFILQLDPYLTPYRVLWREEENETEKGQDNLEHQRRGHVCYCEISFPCEICSIEQTYATYSPVAAGSEYLQLDAGSVVYLHTVGRGWKLWGLEQEEMRQQERVEEVEERAVQHSRYDGVRHSQIISKIGKSCNKSGNKAWKRMSNEARRYLTRQRKI